MTTRSWNTPPKNCELNNFASRLFFVAILIIIPCRNDLPYFHRYALCLRYFFYRLRIGGFELSSWKSAPWSASRPITAISLR